MWRVILISFAFLGVVFYVASGGADYTPAPNSLQVALRDKPFFAPARPAQPPVRTLDEENAPPLILAPRSKTTTPRMAEPVTEPESEPRSASIAPDPAAPPEPASYVGLSGLWLDEEGESDLTLAAPAHTLDRNDALEQRPIERLGVFDAQTLINDVQALPLDAAEPTTAPVLADIRQIAGDSANMHSGPGADFPSIDQLARGTSVEVLERRGAWVELLDLQTGRIGWVADWLVTAAQ